MHRTIPSIAALVAAALIAAACSTGGDTSPSAPDTTAEGDRSAAEETAVVPGDPNLLPPLSGSEGDGPLVPVYTGSEIGPDTWVSTSLTPTLVVPGSDAAWTFRVTDLSDGTSPFGELVYQSGGNTVQIPIDAGLEQGRVYLWRAEADGVDPVGGSFQVDTQLAGVQPSDNVGGVTALLASGEASFAWNSHQMNAIGGPIGFNLHFMGSNTTERGVPPGWDLSVASSTHYTRIEEHSDGTIGLIANNGSVTTYQPSGAETWAPVRLSDANPALLGQAPVITRDADGTFVVTDKQMTTLFDANDDSGIAYVVAVSAGNNPVLSQDWTGGLLRRVTDVASTRSVEFVYGGEQCPAPPSGFVAAPENMLCEVRFWDGSTSRISYVETPSGAVSIGRLGDWPEAGADGASVTDIAYDRAGRITAVRTPLIAAAAAAGIIDANDQQYVTRATYDDAGRVETLTAPAAEPGAPRCERRYDYVSARFTRASDSCLGATVGEYEFDPSTFFPVRLVNTAGQTAEFTWDFASGNIVSQTTFDGQYAEFVYEGGNLVATYGPSRSDERPVTMREFDQFVDGSGETDAMLGLDVTYWPSATDTTVEQIQELGPRLDGAITPSLTVNWTRSPAGNDGGWSALMTGAIDVVEEGTYTFRSDSPIATLRVDNVLCTDGGCDELPLSAGRHQIHIDVSSPTPEATMSIIWSGPDTGGVEQPVPTDRLHPQYGYVTTLRSIDTGAPAALVDNASHTIYDEPATGKFSARRNQAGVTTRLGYDASWDRQSVSIQPNGSQVEFVYWGDDEVATAPCPGALAANQGGAARAVLTSLPGQTASTQWFDEAGRMVAKQFGSSAILCTSYDGTGRVVVQEWLGMGETQRTETTYNADGNPLRARTTSTYGDEVFTSSVEVDLLGRAVRSEDRFGIVTTIAYDARTGGVATRSIEVPGGPSVVIANEYDEFGRVVATSRNGRVLVRIGFDEFGNATEFTYGNGVVARHTYDAQNRITVADWALPDGRQYRQDRTLTVGGQILGSTFVADGVGSAFSYRYDDSRRLAGADVTAGIVDTARSWEYSYDSNSNRIGQVITVGADRVEYRYEYNSADQLIATDDPAAAAGITYDGNGNATQVGPDEFSYDPADRLVRATDNQTTITYERDIDGSIRSRTRATAEGTDTVLFASEGILLGADRGAVSQQLTLAGGAIFTEWFSGSPASEWGFTTISGDLFFTTADDGTPTGTTQLFDPFGNRLTAADAVEPGTLELTWDAVSGNETYDLATPYQMMGARVYIPALGRFVQFDPVVGGSANAYDYANQNPLALRDPSGNAPDALAMLIVGVASLLVGVFAPPLTAAVIGVAIGGLAYLTVYAIERSKDPTTEFSLGTLGLYIGVAAVSAGIGSFMRAAFAADEAAAAGEVIGSEVSAAEDVTAAIDVAAPTENLPSVAVAEEAAIEAGEIDSAAYGFQRRVLPVVEEDDLAIEALDRVRSKLRLYDATKVDVVNNTTFRFNSNYTRGLLEYKTARGYQFGQWTAFKNAAAGAGS